MKVTDLLGRIRSDIDARLAELEPVMTEFAHLESMLAELEEEKAQAQGTVGSRPATVVRFVRRGPLAH